MKLVITQTDTLAQVQVSVQGIAPMPPATARSLGAVIAGSGLVVGLDGTLSAAALSVALSLVATGSTQADALPLAAGVNVFATVPPGAGCVLDATWPGGPVWVVNKGANDLLVYPPGVAQIDVAAAGVPVIIGANQRTLFLTASPATTWSAA